MTIQKVFLPDNDLNEIIDIIRKHPEVESAVLFGSRATGRNNPGSDVDIALFGARVSHETVVAISGELNEETYMPYRFDIMDFKSIGNPAMRESIESTGINIFRNENAIVK